MTITFLLASQSPRRHDLMALLGAPVTIRVSGVNEDIAPGQQPVAYVEDVARRKAEAILATLPRSSAYQPIIVAADTTVVVDRAILGKPESPAEARAMLVALRNRTHLVHTGLCVVDMGTGREAVETHTVEVTMRDYSDAEIAAYIATGDPLDKAGAYAIQHPTFRPVARLDGCYLGVMGLSLCHLVSVLERIAVTPRVDWGPIVAAHIGFPCPLIPGVDN